MRVSRRSNSAHQPVQAMAMRGFTLIELAITVVVLSVLMALAAPLFTGVINDNRLTSNANEIVAGIQIARSEAIRRNVRTIFCGSDNGTTCAATTPWRGWLVFADANGNNIAEAGEIVRTSTISAPVLVRGSANVIAQEIVFRADGLAYASNNLLNANIRVCLPVTNPNLHIRDVNITAGGRVAVRPPIGSGGLCTPPADT
jgi:type IV fimbrial biogenesis protein FimT